MGCQRRYDDRMKPRLLIVEDEQTISEPLAEHLGREGFDVEVAGSIEEGTKAWRATTPDLILLDVMLPYGDLCRLIRTESDVPISMLTARGEEIDRIVGLELGADDYVVKLISAVELVARMRAIIRRGRATVSLAFTYLVVTVLLALTAPLAVSLHERVGAEQETQALTNALSIDAVPDRDRLRQGVLSTGSSRGLQSRRTVA